MYKTVLAIAVLSLAAWCSSAQAGNFTATGAGNWTNNGTDPQATWVPSAGDTGPVAGDNAYIQAAVTYDSGASGQISYMEIRTGASLTLETGLASDNSVSVWRNGTLDLADQTLTVAGDLNLGGNGGAAIVNRTTGSMSAGNWISVNEGTDFQMGAGDTAGYFQVTGSYNNGSEDVYSAATTAGTSNVTKGAQVSGTLTLGADMVLTEWFNFGGSSWGHAGDLYMNGHSLTANDINLGWAG
ncbi:MAG: hypothetical protein ABFD85_05320, partial [Phycisphaerae bacterium]